MPGERHEVESVATHVDGHAARRLGRIDHDERPVLVGETRRAGDVVHVSREVRGVRDRKQARAARELALERAVVERAAPVVRHHGHLAALLVLFAEQRPQHRVVRGRRGHRALAGAQKPRDGDVEGLRGVRAERHARRRRRPQKARKPLAGTKHREPGVERTLRARPGPRRRTRRWRARWQPPPRGACAPWWRRCPNRSSPHGLTTTPAPIWRSTMAYMFVGSPTARRSVSP